METLKQRIQPVLSGRLSVSELDSHTRQALDIFIHFRAADIAESLEPDKIKAELARVPEPVRELVTQAARRAYRKLLKHRR